MEQEEIMCMASNNSSAIESIFSRTSVRSYSAEKIGRSTLQKLLDAAVRAPSAMHLEPWACVVISDRALLRALSYRAKPLFLEKLHHAPASFSDPEFDVFHGAGTLIVICAKPAPFSEADCWLAAENLMLAACSNGLGTCVIGSALEAINLSKKELCIPEDYAAVAPIVVGIPSSITAQTSRKEPKILAWL
jgi:nitroreductase